LQTKLDKLTAQKNAIEQKKKALLIERMTVEMEMTQERIAKLEVIIDVATKAINRKKSELDALNIKIKKVQSLQLRYKNEVAALNKKITLSISTVIRSINNAFFFCSIAFFCAVSLSNFVCNFSFC
jgi:flagellar biosynthesis chaperone FliJ